MGRCPRGERGCAHLQGLHQALHLARLQLRRDGPDEDPHGHVVHGRDVLRVDAPVPSLRHGSCLELASSFLLPARPSLPLCPEQHSAQPGHSASSWASHHHRHRHRPTVLQSHGEGAGQAGLACRDPCQCRLACCPLLCAPARLWSGQPLARSGWAPAKAVGRAGGPHPTPGPGVLQGSLLPPGCAGALRICVWHLSWELGCALRLPGHEGTTSPSRAPSLLR